MIRLLVDSASDYTQEEIENKNWLNRYIGDLLI